MDHCLSELLEQLTNEDLRARGFLANASNHTLLVQVGQPSHGLAAIYKPRDGERPLWDFPTGTLCQREVAAYEVSRALGWELVPPTVLRDGPMGYGSVQLFVPHDPERHYFVLVEEPATHPELVRMAVFDFLVNNADRKAGHVLQAESDNRIVGVDHGLTLHDQPKLRTVIWELGGTALEEEWRADLARISEDLADGPLRDRLEPLLSVLELSALRARACALADLPTLPELPRDRRPYPWPPL